MHKKIVAQIFLCIEFFVHLQSFFLHKFFCANIFLCICTKKFDKTLQMHFFFAFAVELSADNHENFQHHSCITKLCSISQKLCICKVFCAKKNFAFAQKFLHKKNCAAAKFFAHFFLHKKIVQLQSFFICKNFAAAKFLPNIEKNVAKFLCTKKVYFVKRSDPHVSRSVLQ